MVESEAARYCVRFFSFSISFSSLQNLLSYGYSIRSPFTDIVSVYYSFCEVLTRTSCSAVSDSLHIYTTHTHNHGLWIDCWAHGSDQSGHDSHW